MKPDQYPASLCAFAAFAKRRPFELTLHLQFEDDSHLAFGPCFRYPCAVTTIVAAPVQ